MNPDNYGSLPTCKKLAEGLAKKGIVIETEAAYYHIYHPADDIYEWVLCPREGRAGASLQYDDEIPAFSMAEVWRGLPEEIYLGVKTSYHLELVKMEKTNRCTYRAITCSTLGYSAENINPADALIELWIWVLAREE